jgi:1,4-dihydroxy-2-naphthoate octaprenyltransferase
MPKFNDMTKFNAWIKAFRLRTLALSFSVILMGSATAYQQCLFRVEVMLLALLTTLFLQILSNLSNDYGDAMSGADDDGRVGPSRMVQSGLIPASEMKRMMMIFSVLSFVSGVVLLYLSLGNLLSFKFLIFLILGLASILAAIKYTVGKHPYGYKGFGDLFVFIFFGLVGVIGTYYLHTGGFDLVVVLPAAAVGALSSGVLNVNNMRDEETDRRTGKITRVVRNGRQWARGYHLRLILGAMLAMVVYTGITATGWSNWLFLLSFPLLAIHLRIVFKTENRASLDPQLKVLSLTTMFMVLLFFVGLLV